MEITFNQIIPQIQPESPPPRPPENRNRAPPQKWRSTAVWALDLGNGRSVDFESGYSAGQQNGPLPTDRRTKPPRERHLSYTLDEEAQAPPPDDTTHSVFEQSDSPTGWQPKVEQREDGLLLDSAGQQNDGDPPPPDDLPIFWTD